MESFVIREYRPEDIPDLWSLWCRVFGDPPLLVNTFLDLLPEMGSCCVAEEAGELLGAAYLLDGFTLLCPDGSGFPCGYLYAVAVEERARGNGIGAAVSRGAAELGRKRGAERVCTLPAEEGLYAWYGKILSLENRTDRAVYLRSSLPDLPELSAADYLRKREQLLKGIPHVVPNAAVMEYQKLLCRSYGGNLYALEEGILCAYRDDGVWVIPELLLPSAAGLTSRAESFRACCAALPGLQAELRPYLCSDLPLPEGTVWNLSLD